MSKDETDRKIDEILSEPDDVKVVETVEEIIEEDVYEPQEDVLSDFESDEVSEEPEEELEPSEDDYDADEGSYDYFDDDEEFLEGDDITLHEDVNMAIVKQSDTVVSWQVDNFYKDNGNTRSAVSLRTDPPIFTIGNSDGDSVSFIITKEFAGQLESVMGDIYRGYFGVSSKRSKDIGRKGVKGTFERVKEWAVENKFKAGVLGVLVVGLLVAAFVL